MIYLLSFILSFLFGSPNFPSPNDPNFLSEIGPCLSDPNCRTALTEYLQGLEKEEPNQPPAVYWHSIDEINRMRLQAMFERWLCRDSIRKCLREPKPFDPNRLLNVENEYVEKWYLEEDGKCRAERFFRIFDSSDLNKDGIVNMEDFNLLLKDFRYDKND